MRAKEDGVRELPVVVEAQMVDDVVWLPANSSGRGVLASVASPGTPVTLTGGTL